MRIHGLVVVFDGERHEEDIQSLVNVLSTLRGVAAVKPVEQTDFVADEAVRLRVEREIQDRVYEAVWPELAKLRK